MFKKIIACLIIVHGGVMFSSAEQSRADQKERTETRNLGPVTLMTEAESEEIDKVNAELNNEDDWDKAKEIVRKAIARRINPDHLEVYFMKGGFSGGPAPCVVASCKPLQMCVERQNDVEFARFLLEHGASVEKNKDGKPLLCAATTVEMAQLLIEHDKDVLEKHGATVLRHTLSDSHRSDVLLAFYLSQVDPNLPTKEGNCPIHFLMNVSSPLKARLLLQAGARLDTKGAPGNRFSDCTLPQSLKKLMDGGCEIKELREALMEEQKKRKEYCRELPTQLTAAFEDIFPLSISPFPTPLISLTQSFVMDMTLADEKSYEELENEPLPASAY